MPGEPSPDADETIVQTIPGQNEHHRQIIGSARGTGDKEVRGIGDERDDGCHGAER